MCGQNLGEKEKNFSRGYLSRDQRWERRFICGYSEPFAAAADEEEEEGEGERDGKEAKTSGFASFFARQRGSAQWKRKTA